MRYVVVGAAVALAACVHSAPKTLTPSIEETVNGTPDATFQAALQSVSNQGLPIREADRTTHVIQTEYVDIAQYDPQSASQYPQSERLVRFKVLIAPNPNGPGSSVAILGVYSPFTIGFATSERNERTIPKEHPAMKIVRRIRDDIVKAVGGG